MLAALAVGSVAGCGTRLPPFARTPSSIAPSATPVLDDLPCPPASVDGPTVCAHEVDATAVPVVVRATDHVAPIDDASGVAFVLTNATGERLRFNPNNPDVYRYGERGYDRIRRRSSGNGVVDVPVGGEYEWRLTDLAVFDRLSPGSFLFAVRAPTAGTMETDWVTCLAPFRLTAAGG